MYLAIVVCESNALTRFLEIAVFSLVCVTLLYNVENGLQVGRERAAWSYEMAADIERGAPLTALVSRHRLKWACPSVTEEQFREDIQLARRQRLWHFGDVQDDPPMRATAVPDRLVRVRDMERDGAILEVVGPRPRLVIAFPGPRRIYGVRFALIALGGKSRVGFTVSWLRAPASDHVAGVGSEDVQVQYNTLNPFFRRTQTVWIDDTVSEIAIQPNAGVNQFEVGDIELLEPMVDAVSAAR